MRTKLCNYRKQHCTTKYCIIFGKLSNLIIMSLRRHGALKITLLSIRNNSEKNITYQCFCFSLSTLEVCTAETYAGISLYTYLVAMYL